MVDFGGIAVGSTAEVMVRFENEGPERCGNTLVWAFDFATPPVFTLVSNECTGAAGSKMTLNVGESCSAVVRFGPRATGRATAQVLFMANPGPTSMNAIPLVGEGR